MPEPCKEAKKLADKFVLIFSNVPWPPEEHKIVSESVAKGIQACMEAIVDEKLAEYRRMDHA